MEKIVAKKVQEMIERGMMADEKRILMAVMSSQGGRE